MALELNLDETLNFIGRAGHTLSRSNKFDTIIEYFIVNKKYNIIENNAVLFEFDLPLIWQADKCRSLNDQNLLRIRYTDSVIYRRRFFHVT